MDKSSGKVLLHKGECSISHTAEIIFAFFSQKKLYAFLISLLVRNGDVGCKTVITSNVFPCFSYSCNTYLTASQVDDVSVAVSAFLKNGTSAPFFSAISAYISESVDTCTVSYNPLSIAAFIA